MIKPSSLLNSTKTFNSLINHFSSHGDPHHVLSTFSSMLANRFPPDTFTFPSLLKACASLQLLPFGLSIHQQVLVNGFSSSSYTSSFLVNLYAKVGLFGHARKLFDEMRERDVVHWTVMIGCYSRAGIVGEAFYLVNEMTCQGIKPGPVTLLELLSGISEITQLQCLHAFALVHGFESDLVAMNSILNLYCKCDCVGDAKYLFDQMEKRDMVSWNTMISGFASLGNMSEILKLLYRMRHYGLRPDHQTFGASLSVCGTMCDLGMGKMLHSQIVKTGFDVDIHLRTALMTMYLKRCFDMYLKCGYLEVAKRCFDSISRKDFVSWGTLIAGYGFHGKGEIALEIYSEYLRSGMEPNHLIFLAVLSSCSHNGMVQHGLEIFSSLVRDFGVEPNHEHLACVVDLLCRAKRVEEAFKFYKETFTKPSIDVLGIILDACRANGKTEVEDVVCRDMIELKPVDAGHYVRLVHSFSVMKRWNEVSESWNQMRSLGLKKLPGWSKIEMNGRITTFFMNHTSLSDETASVLKLLSKEMKQIK